MLRNSCKYKNKLITKKSTQKIKGDRTKRLVKQSEELNANVSVVVNVIYVTIRKVQCNT